MSDYLPQSNGTPPISPDSGEGHHPYYGPCDGFGPKGQCSQCTGLIERDDGSLIKSDGSDEVVRLAPDSGEVEKVARALHEAHKPWCDYTYPFEHPQSSREVYETLARVALEAMDDRESTTLLATLKADNERLKKELRHHERGEDDGYQKTLQELAEARGERTMSEKPMRIQLSRKKGWKMPPNTVKVDRTTEWGNPFPVRKAEWLGSAAGGNWLVERATAYHICGTKKEAADVSIKLFQAWLEQPQQDKHRQRARLALKGKNLACWCALDQPCHADILLELANRPVCEPVEPSHD